MAKKWTHFKQELTAIRCHPEGGDEGVRRQLTKEALERAQERLPKVHPEGRMAWTSGEGMGSDSSARSDHYRRRFEALARASVRGWDQAAGSSKDREAYIRTHHDKSGRGKRDVQRRERERGSDGTGKG